MAEHKQPSTWTCDICGNGMPVYSRGSVIIAVPSTQENPLGKGDVRAEDACLNCVQTLIATARSLAPNKVDPE